MILRRRHLRPPNDIGGYKHQFLHKPHEQYICRICSHPSHNPHLSRCCGHNFCKSCLDNYSVKKTSVTCPFCQEKEFVTFPNVQVDREIRNLHVMCTNKERGCEWQGELNDINNHLGNSDHCQFADVYCSNECGKMLQRRYLTSHVETECSHRKVDCQHCHITGEHQFIEKEHKEQCPKLPISCPNVCWTNKKIAREDMEAHRKECPLEMVQCEYHNVGCEERMMRKRKKKHELENTEDHLLMIKLKLSTETESSKIKLASTEAKLATTETKLASIEAELAAVNSKMCNVEVMLRGLIKASGHSDTLIDLAQSPVHLTTMATNVIGVAKTCPVIIKMSNFAAIKDKEVSWYSEPFISHNGGYKMSLSVFSAGDGNGKGTHLSLFLCLMKGPHDDELTWPLRGKFKVKLLNQTSDCEHNSMTVKFNDSVPCIVAGRVTDGERAAGWGKPKFISHECLHKVASTCQYLRDDCIFLQVSKLL